MQPVPKHLVGRLLFPNPACVLVSANDVDGAGPELCESETSPGHTFNAMTVTWLTPVDNHGTFVMSLNSQRHTTSNLLRGHRRSEGGGAHFTLSPACAGMEALLIALGSCSGRTGAGKGDVGPSKVSRCGLTLVEPGSDRSTHERPAVLGSSSSTSPPLMADRVRQLGAQTVPAVSGAPAHIACKAVSVLLGSHEAPPEGVSTVHGTGPTEALVGSDPVAPGTSGPRKRPAADSSPIDASLAPDIGHTLFLCKAEGAWVDPAYWHDGKLFGAPPSAGTAVGSGKDVPPLLCFSGSHRFVHMTLPRVSDSSALPVEASPAPTLGPAMSLDIPSRPSATHSVSHDFLFRHLLSAGAETADHLQDPTPLASLSKPTTLDASPTAAHTSTALVLLNTPGHTPDFLRAMWDAASVIVAADGAANRLRRDLPPSLVSSYLPNLIVGDLDSLSASTRSLYESHGVPVERDPDQDSTDLMKCLERLIARQEKSGVRYRVVIFGGFGGRLDQEMQNLNTLYSARYQKAFAQMVVLSDECIACLLQAGTSHVRPCFPFEGPTVGLIPLGGPASLSTHGLKWDVSQWPTSFGGHISTSNHMLGYDEWCSRVGHSWWSVKCEELQCKAAALSSGGGFGTSAGLEGLPLTAEQEGLTSALEYAASRAAACSKLAGGAPSGLQTDSEAGGQNPDRAGIRGVVVSASQPVIWTGTLDADAVVAAWRASRRE